MASILVIEDNNEIQEILRTLLTEEHEVIQAFSGTEGIMQFDKGGIDLVLLDIMLPGKMATKSCKLFDKLVRLRSSCSLLWVIKSSSANTY